MRTALFVLFFAILLCVLRFFIPTHTVSPAGSYEAFAHLFVGGLIGAWLVSKRKLYLLTVVAMSIVELAAFLTKA